MGTVYLLHFKHPLAHANHYLGWTDDLPARLAMHRASRGARIVEVLVERGGDFLLAKTWPGSRALERSMKGRSLRAYCPICRPGRERAPLLDEDRARLGLPPLAEIAQRHRRR